MIALLVLSSVLMIILLILLFAGFSMFELLIWTFDTLTLPAYYLVQKPWKIKRHSQTKWAEQHFVDNASNNNAYSYWQVKSDVAVTGNSHYNSLNKLLDNAEHLSEFLKIAQHLYKNQNCLGRRKVETKVLENGMKKFRLSAYEWLTYEKAQQKIDDLVKVFHYKFQLKKGNRVAIFAETSFEWFITFFALQCLGCEVVALHTSFNDEDICYALNLTKPEYLFTHPNLAKKINQLKSNIHTVSKLVIINDSYADNEFNVNDLKLDPNRQFEIIDFHELKSENLPEINLEQNEKLLTSDIAIILFTSGSSGIPKGVLLSHSNLINGIVSFMKRLQFSFDMNNEDTFLGYLPMSHIFEVICEILFFVNGVKIAYGKPSTCTIGSPLLVKGCESDLQAGKITIWIGVPLIFERVRNHIKTSLRTCRLPFVSAIYEYAYNYKKKWAEHGYRCPITDALLFKLIRKQYGGRLKVIITGGAVIRRETQAFIKQYLDVLIVLGYASTETSGSGCLSPLNEFDHANSMAPNDGIKLRLEDWWEGGYSVNEKNPKGEILLGSKGVSSLGYLENEEETKKDFFEENGIRWWRSGDIGEIDVNGHLTIIDRKKDIVKLQFGKYVALGKIESILKNCLYVENIVLHGDSSHNYLIGLVKPNKEMIIKLANSINAEKYGGLCSSGEQVNIRQDELVVLYKDKDVERSFLDMLSKFGKANKLTSKEIPHMIELCPEEWSPKNGLLTASMKTRRTQVHTFYKKSIDRMYQRLEEKF